MGLYFWDIFGGDTPRGCQEVHKSHKSVDRSTLNYAWAMRDWVERHLPDEARADQEAIERDGEENRAAFQKWKKKNPTATYPYYEYFWFNQEGNHTCTSCFGWVLDAAWC